MCGRLSGAGAITGRNRNGTVRNQGVVKVNEGEMSATGGDIHTQTSLCHAVRLLSF